MGLARLHRRRQHPLPLRGHGLHPRVPGVAVDGPVAVRTALARAHAEHGLRRPLDVDEGLAHKAVVQGRHETVAGLEGDQVRARVALGDGLQIEPGLDGRHQQRALHRVPVHPQGLAVFPLQRGIVAQGHGTQGLGQPRILLGPHRLPLVREGTVGIVAGAGQRQHPRTRVHRGHGHRVAGQGAGLVRADHADGAQGLHRGQPADDGVAPGHALHADGQRDGHDRRQALRDRGHGQTHRGQEHLRRGVIAHQDAEGEAGAGKDQDGGREPAAELGHLPQQRRGEPLHPGHQGADAADLGAGPGGDDDAGALAMGHQGARIGHAAAIRQGGLRRQRGDALVHRDRFAGQRRLLDLQSLGPQNPQVRRDLVAGLQLHQVAGHQLRGVHGDQPAAAPGHGVGREHPPDGLQGVLGLALLHESDGRVDEHDAQDDAGVEPVPQQGRDPRRRQQHVDQQVVELGEEAQQRAAGLGLGQSVGAVGDQAPAGLLGAQALAAAADPIQRLLGAQVMPLGPAGLRVPGHRRGRLAAAAPIDDAADDGEHGQSQEGDQPLQGDDVEDQNVAFEHRGPPRSKTTLKLDQSPAAGLRREALRGRGGAWATRARPSGARARRPARRGGLSG